jgi:hypothetical protein
LGTRKGYTTVEEGLAWWRRYFMLVGKSRFLTGRAPPLEGRAPFVADLEWLIGGHFAGIVEGKYHDNG